MYEQSTFNRKMSESIALGHKFSALELTNLLRLGGIILLTSQTACGVIASENQQTKELAPPNLQITTYSQMIGGVAGNQSEATRVSLKFTIAPALSGVPVQDEAMAVLSDESGRFHINLAPGEYWIGAKEQIDNPEGYGITSVTVNSQLVELIAGKVTQVSVYRRGYAP